MSQASPSPRALNNRTFTALTAQSQAPSSTTALARSSIGSLHDSQFDGPRPAERPAVHQRFVLTDPATLQYLEEDPSTQVLARREKLEGYECYLVEQWACSRTHPTFIITTFTGDTADIVLAYVISVPTNEASWSSRLKTYFKALDQYHARRRETPLGILMVTNLSAFPSSLSVIAIPNGDAKSSRHDFYVNENLKRLGCSGRVGLSLSKPSGATSAKFYQLYRASDKNPLDSAVIELVKLCQIALVLFDNLAAEYADGLLCDMTEKAISDWWVEFGNEYYNTEPHDGILGPSTVAGLLGLLTGARNRLHACGEPVSKDVFDVEHTKRAIAHFQKSQRIPKSRRLDHQTLRRLHRATAKAASGEGWLVPRAVKSTVAELSGKGGEMVMDMVGGREKAGIAEVETVDIELFVQLVHGARSKWLWQGKPRKAQSSDMFNRLSGDDNLVFQSTHQGGYEWSSRRKETSGEIPRDLIRAATGDSQRARDEDRAKLSRRHPDRAPSHKAHESSRGFGRIKDAVRGHGSKHSKEESDKLGVDAWKEADEQPGAVYDHAAILPASSFPADSTGQSSRNPVFSSKIAETPVETSDMHLARADPVVLERSETPSDPPIDAEQDFVSQSPTASISGSTYRGVDLDDVLPFDEMPDRNVGPLLRRTRSLTRPQKEICDSKNQAYWPRHLSFSIAEDSVLTWDGINEPVEERLIREAESIAQWQAQMVNAEDAKVVRRRILDTETSIGDWVAHEVAGLRYLNNLIDEDQEALHGLYRPRLEEYQALRTESTDKLGFEKSQLAEGLQEIEVLGAKLEYEIQALESKVKDVEDGVTEFERQVNAVEDRVTELEYDMRMKESWFHWIVRSTTGLGKAPGNEATQPG
ncbi:hypothetical protein BLS_008045 [Venturia inaequalis]|uniref:STB6-like N-terminal domain-containing protein n=1 Tax=Venturia inaequalis TaxID=5025 RepID=A0A8H3VQA4_VENIN|nr:hypothetical protein BLS_008045 [Venturia inaequalis]KAE9988792.1 hypothetical protein EG328_007396 [Venturia inaequalis]KAE9993404.1 hypothetical protein EG327_005175 [Venturia inaequalis]RDI82788.1 hypothetical protein Vi05172_g7235 [Venturia inaequalis]